MSKIQKTVQLDESLIQAIKELAKAKGWSFQATLGKAADKGLKQLK